MGVFTPPPLPPVISSTANALLGRKFRLNDTAEEDDERRLEKRKMFPRDSNEMDGSGRVKEMEGSGRVKEMDGSGRVVVFKVVFQVTALGRSAASV